MQLLLLLACTDSLAFFEDGMVGSSFADTGTNGCAGDTLLVWADGGAEVGPRRVVEGGTLPLQDDGEGPGVTLRVAATTSADYARVHARLSDAQGDVAGEGDVALAAAPWPGDPCGRTFDGPRLEVAGVVDPDTPYQLEIGLNLENVDERLQTWSVFLAP